MKITQDYNTSLEKDALKNEAKMKNWTLVEDQIHFDGKHLVFDDGQPEPIPRDFGTEIDNLNIRMKALERR